MDVQLQSSLLTLSTVQDPQLWFPISPPAILCHPIPSGWKVFKQSMNQGSSESTHPINCVHITQRTHPKNSSSAASADEMLNQRSKRTLAPATPTTAWQHPSNPLVFSRSFPMIWFYMILRFSWPTVGLMQSIFRANTKWSPWKNLLGSLLPGS